MGRQERDKRALHEHWKGNLIIRDDRLLKAFPTVPREKFILKEDSDFSYGDYPLGILAGQTISQPTTVMLMTQALEVKEGMKVLEVGAGSGYQAAILAEMVGPKGKVISVEYLEPLVDFARENLRKAGYERVQVVLGDGGDGYPDEAPYDRIIVTCACPSVPPPLQEQLKNGGIMVIPIESFLYEDMQVIRKKKDSFTSESIGSFSFVPLRGKYGE